MALLHTPEKDDGFHAPDFELKGVDGRTYTYGDIQSGHGTVVAFICNHCPYVLAIIERMVVDAKALQAQGIGFVAGMSNDVEAYPEDNFENMKLFAEKYGFSFPYLIDETQSVAKAYDAVCTPDIFGFNADAQLAYRGRLDSAGPKEADNGTVRELVEAMSEIAEGGESSASQTPSMGCSIKWK